MDPEFDVANLFYINALIKNGKKKTPAEILQGQGHGSYTTTQPHRILK